MLLQNAIKVFLSRLISIVTNIINSFIKYSTEPLHIIMQELVQLFAALNLIP